MPARPAIRSSCRRSRLRLRADGDGDGYADIWRSEDDAFASIANYLRDAGWKREPAVGRPGADPAEPQPRRDPLAAQPAALPGGLSPPQPLADGARMARAGRRAAAGAGLPDNEMATLIETRGADADGYLLTTNYRAILDYNCSNFYALSVGLLADAIAAAIDGAARRPALDPRKPRHVHDPRHPARRRRRRSSSPPPLRPRRRRSIRRRRVAYLIDLSSGAVLLAKNADLRMPPASMAKMMTTEVAFELIDRGELPLEQDVHGAAGDLAEVAWPAAGSTMFLSPNEQVSVENLLHGIVTLSGNDASVVLAECIAGTEQAFAAQMNALAKKLGLTNSRFGNSNGWPDEGGPMSPRATSRRWPGPRSSAIPSSTSNSTASRASPGARPWARARRSPRATATRSSARCRAPTGSRPATPTKPATASPARPSRTAAGW